MGMKVVIGLENEKQEHETETEKPNRFVKIKKSRLIIFTFIVVFLTAGSTVFALSFKEEKASGDGQASVYRPEFQKLYNAYDLLRTEYFKDLDQEALVNGAIDGMLNALEDPYSDYMTAEEAKKFHEGIEASFEGIGAEVQEQDGFVVIVSPIKGSPAEKAGLLPKDKILKVDEKNIQGMSANEAVLLIRGEKGTDVTLTIQRAGASEPAEIKITRDEIPIETVYSEKVEDGIWKVQVTSFAKTTYDDLVRVIDDLEAKGMTALILDLRQNPGGLLDQAIKISNLFVPEGKVLFQNEMKDGTIEQYVADGGKKVNVPVAMIIDKGSASASEILAAAVKESAGIPLVGHQSFGKGTVQATKDFTDGSNMKFTSGKWLTPEGNWIHEKGIEPDVVVDLPKYAQLPLINPDVEMKEATISNDVKAAEEMLEVLGYQPGKIDGFYDEETVEAVKSFQRDIKQEATGILKGETTIELMNKVREKIVENDTQMLKALELVKKK